MSMWGPETEREWHEEEARNEARDYRERLADEEWEVEWERREFDERGPLDDDEVDEPGACPCGHDPACGFASIYQDGKQTWLCHDDDHSCYAP